MRKLVVCAAVVLGIAVAQSASACEWMHQAAKPATVVTCDKGTCSTEQPTQDAAASTTETAPATAQPAEEATAPASSVVASAQR